MAEVMNAHNAVNDFDDSKAYQAQEEGDIAFVSALSLVVLELN